MPETQLLTPVRPHIAAITLAVGATLGILATIGISAAVPAVAAGPARAVVTASADLGVGREDAEAAVSVAHGALTDAETVIFDVQSAGFDLGAESTAIDTTGVIDAMESLTAGTAESMLNREALTADLTAETEQVAAQSVALRARLDAAFAQKQAEEAAAAALAAAQTPDGARAVAQQIAASDFGWGANQFSCLNSLWQKESGWNYQAYNPSGATGIPQALPGSKMASAGSDWQTNPTTQIRWGLDYIQRAYGSPCAAWGHSQSVNWY